MIFSNSSLVSIHTQLYFTKLAAKHRKHRKQTVTHNKNQNKLTQLTLTFIYSVHQHIFQDLNSDLQFRGNIAQMSLPNYSTRIKLVTEYTADIESIPQPTINCITTQWGRHASMQQCIPLHIADNHRVTNTGVYKRQHSLAYNVKNR